MYVNRHMNLNGHNSPLYSAIASEAAAMSNTTATSTVWIIGNDASVSARVEALLRLLVPQTMTMSAERLQEEAFWMGKPDAPALIVLDVSDELDAGLQAIRRIKRARLRAPIVVLTKDFSRDFGAKIVSEGVRYYLAHDFSAEELREVAESLLNLRRPAG